MFEKGRYSFLGFFEQGDEDDEGILMMMRYFSAFFYILINLLA